jgi:dihydroorotase
VSERIDLVVRGGRVVCAETGFDAVADVAIAGDRIVAVTQRMPADAPRPSSDGAVVPQVVDATGKLVIPGLVDLGVHVRAPGREVDEPLASTLRAALRGGVTTFVALPDTDPTVEGGDDVAHRLAAVRAAHATPPTVVVAGCLTRRREGKELADMADMVAAGATVFTDVHAFDDAEVLRRALEYALSAGARCVLLDPTDASLSRGAVAVESPIATRLGLRGAPVFAQSIGMARLGHCAASIAASIGGLSAGVGVHAHGLFSADAIPSETVETTARVTASVTAATLLLDETALIERPYDAALRLWPPLPTADDRRRLLDGVKRGRLAVTSGHRPVPNRGKDVPFADAEPGGSALAVALPLLLDVLTPHELVRAMSASPARILGLADRGRIEAGARADLVIVDENAGGAGDIVDAASLASPSPASPFLGRRTRARVVATIVGGLTAYAARAGGSTT